MKTRARLSRIILVLAGAMVAGFCVAINFQITAAADPIAAGAVPSDVIQAIDAVHAAAQQADAATLETQHQSTVVPITSKGWSLDGGRVLAVGAGVAVGVVAFNYITSGTAIPQALVAAVGSLGARATTAGAVSRTVTGVTVGSSMVGIYGLVSAMVGGVAGNYLYGAMQPVAPEEKPQL